MILLRIAVAVLLLLPVAAADGIHANARYLETDERCWNDSSSGGWSNNTSYHSWYHYESGCFERLTYASAEAGDDNGAIARADVGGYNANHSMYDSRMFQDVHESPYGTTWSGYYGSVGSYESTWSRSATVSTREAQLQAEHRCRESSWNYHTSYGRETYDSNTSDTSHGWSSQNGYGQGCDDAVRAQAAGEDVRATRWDACSASDRRSSYNRESTWYGDEWSASSTSNSSSSACGQGVVAARGDEYASAAVVSACTQHAERWTSQESSGNETYDGYSDVSRESCTEGAWVDSSEGVTAFAGSMTYREDVCYGSSAEEWCWTYDSAFRGVYVEWAHNPLGPHPIVVGLP